MCFSWFPWDAASWTICCSGEEFEQVFGKIYELSRRANFQIKTTEAMHYRRYLLQHNLEERKMGHGHGTCRHGAAYEAGTPTADGQTRTMSWATRRVNDGKGFVFISHVGNVYPSGFLPIHAGNMRETPLGEIYRNAPIFKALRDTKRLEGKCGACEYKEICGGSRARAYALTGDPLAAGAVLHLPTEELGSGAGADGGSVQAMDAGRTAGDAVEPPLSGRAPPHPLCP